MTDEVDQAFEAEQEFIKHSLKHSKVGGRRLAATGRCHNCEEPLPSPELFCDVDCRDDYDLREKMQGINGRL